MPDEPKYLDDYITVNQRIAMFHAANEHGAIRTRCIYDDAKTIKFTACVHRMCAPCQIAENHVDCLNAAGTGWAEEIRGAGYVNKTSALENCETSAVGRALAMAGIAVEKSVASKDEIEQAQAERERQEREDNDKSVIETYPNEGGERHRREGNVRAIGKDEARVVIDHLKGITDGAGLRLIASDIHGADIGDCDTIGDAVNAVAELTPMEREALERWAKEKAEVKT